MRETIQNTNGKQFHAVSLSGGKDSSAMLLLMIERDMPINMVLSADTGMEFPEMYEHLAKLDEHLFRERGIHITTLRHPKGFEYLMFDEPKQKPRSLENRAKLGIPPYGNGWPGIRVRWCTGQLKTHLTTATYYRWERELLTAANQAPCSCVPAVTFAELPASKQVSCNVAERCATLHIGKVSLDIYPGCDAEQLRLLVELLRLC
jgi:hypothetical protein